MSQRLVSIIIPTYNRAHLIVETLDSVVSQSYKNIELIIVDDGSTDNTRKVLSPYIERDQIVYIYQKNTGNPGIARNTGIKQASGEYIAFLDSDDILHRESVQNRVEFLNEHPDIGLIFSDYDIFYEIFSKDNIKEPTSEDRTIISEVLSKYGRRIDSQNHIIHKKCIYDLLLFNFICTITVMIKRETIKQAGMFDKKFIVGEDHDLWLRIIQFTNLGYLQTPLSYVRLHDSITANKIEFISGKLFVLEKYYKKLNGTFGIKRRIRHKIGNWHFRRGYHYFKNNEFLSAKKDFLKAFYFNPIKLLHLKCFFYAFIPINTLKFFHSLRVRKN